MSGSHASGGFWSADIWADINNAIATVAGQVRVVQKIFPTTRVPGALHVPADAMILGPPLGMVEGQTNRLVEIWVSFQLTRTQVANEATEKAGRKLARLAARTLA